MRLAKGSGKILAVFAVLLCLNAHGIVSGWYG